MSEEITTQLANGVRIRNCVRKVEEYCDDIPAYDIYDRIATPQDNAISILDICLANNVGAGMDVFAIRRFWRHVCDHEAEIKKRLSKISADTDLHEVDEEVFFRNLRDLFALFFGENKISRVFYTRATKTLHKKRPRLIPIVDGKIVIDGYLGTRGWLGTSNDADYLVEVTKRIKEDVGRNLALLQEIRKRLQPDKGGDLTLLRIFDVLLYQHYSNQSQ